MNQPSKSAFVQISEIASANALSEPFALPADVISRFEQSGIQPDEIEKIIGSRQELFQLVEEHARLSPDQSERAARLAKIVRLAEHVFGNGEKAFIWLRYPNSELGEKGL